MSETILNVRLLVDHEGLSGDELRRLTAEALEGTTILRALVAGEAGAVIEEVLDVKVPARPPRMPEGFSYSVTTVGAPSWQPGDGSIGRTVRIPVGAQVELYRHGSLVAVWTVSLEMANDGQRLAAFAIEKAEELRAYVLSDPSASTLGPFARDSGTSRRAALDAYPRQGSQRARVIGSLRMGGDATREELAIRLGLSENTIRPRVKELIEGGWVEETDHTRLTTRGSEAVLLALTFKAREELGRRLAEAREEPGGQLGMVP